MSKPWHSIQVRGEGSGGLSVPVYLHHDSLGEYHLVNAELVDVKANPPEVFVDDEYDSLLAKPYSLDPTTYEVHIHLAAGHSPVYVMSGPARQAVNVEYQVTLQFWYASGVDNDGDGFQWKDVARTDGKISFAFNEVYYSLGEAFEELEVYLGDIDRKVYAMMDAAVSYYRGMRKSGEVTFTIIGVR